MPKAFTAVQRAPMRELSDEYEGEFLLIKILENHGHPGDRPAELLAHSADWNELSRQSRKVHKREPAALLTIVHGGTKWEEGQAFRREIARIAAEEEWVSANGW